MTLWIKTRWRTLLLVLGLIEDYGPDNIRHYGDWYRLHGHDGRKVEKH